MMQQEATREVAQRRKIAPWHRQAARENTNAAVRENKQSRKVAPWPQEAVRENK